MLIEHFSNIFNLLADNPQNHRRDSSFYLFLDGLAKEAFEEARLKFEASQPVALGELGLINLPYEKMGAIDSIDLFGLDELLMFSFYYRNRGNYARAVDIGANIGLHSILLSLCGCSVEAYEPDPSHYSKLLRNLELNNISSCKAHQAAVSEKDGEMQFVRVFGNTTSSHLAGAKPNPYGDLERFDVDVKDIKEIALRADFMKIDAEGHEAVLLTALPMEYWESTDSFVEVGSPENAYIIYEHFVNSSVSIFAQKIGWSRVTASSEMPVSYKEGGIFISIKPVMPWSVCVAPSI